MYYVIDTQSLATITHNSWESIISLKKEAVISLRRGYSTTSTEMRQLKELLIVLIVNCIGFNGCFGSNHLVNRPSPVRFRVETVP